MSDQSKDRNGQSENQSKQPNTDNLQTGDSVTVELEGKVVDTMDSHGVFRIEVEGQKVEVVPEEVIEIEQPLRAVDKRECGRDGE